MKLMLKIAGGIIIALVVLVAGCTALLAGGANEVQKESDKTAITPSEYRSIKTGMTRSAVVSKLGKPADQQEMDSAGITVEGTGVSADGLDLDCIYYNQDGELLGSMYQFCFESGKLESKASY